MKLSVESDSIQDFSIWYNIKSVFFEMPGTHTSSPPSKFNRKNKTNYKSEAKSVGNGIVVNHRRIQFFELTWFFVTFAEVIQDNRDETWKKKTIETTYFLIYSRVEDRISGMNETVI